MKIVKNEGGAGALAPMEPILPSLSYDIIGQFYIKAPKYPCLLSIHTQAIKDRSQKLEFW